MIQFLYFKVFNNRVGLSHFITTRDGGNSEAFYRSLNLSSKSGDREERVHENRNILAAQLQIEPGQMLFPGQCHTAEVKCILPGYKLSDLPETDGLITNQPGYCLCVLAADCVPVLLYDPGKKVVAAIHAGWKGTVKQIIPKTINTMIQEYDSVPEEILAGIGPAISFGKYEVGVEVASEFRKLFTDPEGVIIRNTESQRDHIDLQKANKKLLIRSGLQEKNIEVKQICTYSNPGIFFSARRDGYHSGRFAAGICLKNMK